MPWRKTTGLAFVVALSGAMAPGPMLALVISQVLAQGMMAAAGILVGHALLELLVVILLAQGLAQWLGRPRIRAACSIGGGLMLLWMGWGLAAGVSSASLAGSASNTRSWWGLVLAGAVVSVTNPYFTGWWISVGSGQVATLDLRTPKQWTAFYLGHELGDFVWYLAVAAILVLGKGWLSDATYRGMLWGCVGVMGILGFLFLGLGFRNWRQRAAATGKLPEETAPACPQASTEEARS